MKIFNWLSYNFVKYTPIYVILLFFIVTSCQNIGPEGNPEGNIQSITRIDGEKITFHYDNSERLNMIKLKPAKVPTLGVGTPIIVGQDEDAEYYWNIEYNNDRVSKIKGPYIQSDEYEYLFEYFFYYTNNQLTKITFKDKRTNSDEYFFREYIWEDSKIRKLKLEEYFEITQDYDENGNLTASSGSHSVNPFGGTFQYDNNEHFLNNLPLELRLFIGHFGLSGPFGKVVNSNLSLVLFNFGQNNMIYRKDASTSEKIINFFDIDYKYNLDNQPIEFEVKSMRTVFSKTEQILSKKFTIDYY